jgi:diguanylate cyclase
VDDITQCLREIEESVDVAGRTDNDPKQLLALLIDELLTLKVKRKTKQQLKQLKKSLSDQTPQQIIDQLKLCFQALVESDNKASFNWNPFTRSKRDTEPLSTEADVETDSTASQRNKIPDSLRDALHNFVEQLGSIDIYRKATGAIKQQLSNLQSYDQLSPLIEQIASVLLEAANQEHIQFETFLQKLNKRLLHVASYLNQAAAGHDGMLSDTRKLDDELKHTIEELKIEIAEAPGLGSLKDRLLASFEHIFSSVNRFKESQITRVQASMAELQIIKEQLQVTEEEAERLKAALQEQRFRAYNDPLTQLPNRYAYNERLSQEYTRWRRYRSPLSLAVCDIDHFKKVNDEKGHIAGDKVLQHVAEVLQQGIRESDFIARYGGEEFVVLMPETNLTDATKAINKLRLRIAKESVPINTHEKLNITLSFGVAEFEGSDTASDVFAKADRALYRAKEKGRNQVCCERSSIHATKE